MPLMDLLQGAFRVLRPNACILIGLIVAAGSCRTAEWTTGMAMDADLSKRHSRTADF
jgi:hypothetical protein